MYIITGVIIQKEVEVTSICAELLVLKKQIEGRSLGVVSHLVSFAVLLFLKAFYKFCNCLPEHTFTLCIVKEKQRKKNVWPQNIKHQ